VDARALGLLRADVGARRVVGVDLARGDARRVLHVDLPGARARGGDDRQCVTVVDRARDDAHGARGA
jgi:hypothetical protein